MKYLPAGSPEDEAGEVAFDEPEDEEGAARIG